MSETVYGCADVAQLLRVTPQAVSNYRARYDDAPAPEYATTDGRPYWTAAGMDAWQKWQDYRRLQRPKMVKSRAAHDAVEKLREQLNPS